MDKGKESGRRDDDLIEDAVEYFSSCFPNPGRDGCPRPARLRDLASSAHLVTGEVRAHLFQCSKCFNEFRRQRSIVTATAETSGPGGVRSFLRERVQAMAIAACVVMAVGLGLVLWVGAERPARSKERETRGSARPTSAQHRAGSAAGLPDRPASALPTVVAIQLRASDLRRGTSPSIESAAPGIAIRPGPTRFEIQLPAGYPDGLYHVAIVDPFDRVLVESSARAVDRVLVAVTDATGLETGRRFLRIGAAAQPQDYLPIVVEDP
jgi:hypothetical protein